MQAMPQCGLQALIDDAWCASRDPKNWGGQRDSYPRPRDPQNCAHINNQRLIKAPFLSTSSDREKRMWHNVARFNLPKRWLRSCEKSLSWSMNIVAERGSQPNPQRCLKPRVRPATGTQGIPSAGPGPRSSRLFHRLEGEAIGLPGREGALASVPLDKLATYRNLKICPLSPFMLQSQS
jgi:hypothetical protein